MNVERHHIIDLNIFKVGTKKKGNDGNMWIIVKNKNGVKRWSKIK
jgi:hypothetical protein